MQKNESIDWERGDKTVEEEIMMMNMTGKEIVSDDDKAISSVFCTMSTMKTILKNAKVTTNIKQEMNVVLCGKTYFCHSNPDGLKM